ncbi:MAG: M14 family metallopeptidase [Rikenellaceae bacterium]
MKKELLFKMSSPYRDDFKIYGYRFGEGEKCLAVVGAIRGDEIEQQYTCASLVKRLTALEASGALVSGHEILVIPSANHFSMNIGKRFWSMDNTDINRMFPGYDKGETTQRIAAALFDSVKDYKYGIQLASYYIPGGFIPHVRMLKTGFQPEHEANYFGLPYVYLKEVVPYETTLLNYNWQIWETKAFSLYTGHISKMDDDSVNNAIDSLLRFMVNIGALSASIRPGYLPQTVTDADIITVRTTKSGMLHKLKRAQQSVKVGDLLAEVVDPYDASIREQIFSPVDGVIFFHHDNPLIIEGARAFQIIEERII